MQSEIAEKTCNFIYNDIDEIDEIYDLRELGTIKVAALQNLQNVTIQIKDYVQIQEEIVTANPTSTDYESKSETSGNEIEEEIYTTEEDFEQESHDESTDVESSGVSDTEDKRTITAPKPEPVIAEEIETEHSDEEIPEEVQPSLVADDTELKELQNELHELKEKYNTEKQTWKDQLFERDKHIRQLEQLNHSLDIKVVDSEKLSASLEKSLAKIKSDLETKNTEINNLRLQNQELDSKNHELAGEINQLQQELEKVEIKKSHSAELKTSKSKSRDLLDANLSELSEVEETLHDVRHEAQTLKQSFNGKISKHRRNQSEDSEKQRLQVDFNQKQQELDNLVIENNKLKTRLETAQDQLKRVEAAHEIQTENFMKKFKESEEMKNKQIEQLRDRLVENEEKVKLLNTGTEEQQKLIDKLSNLETHLRQQRALVTELEENKKKLEEKIHGDRLEHEKRLHQERMNNLEMENKTHSAKMDKDEYEMKMTLLKQRIVTLEEMVQDSAQQLQLKEKQLKQSTNELSALSKKSMQNEEINRNDPTDQMNTQSTIVELKGLVSAKVLALKTVQAELRACEESITELHEKLKHVTLQKNEAESESFQKSAIASSLAARVKWAENQLKLKDDQIYSIQAKPTRTYKQLEDMQSTMGSPGTEKSDDKVGESLLTQKAIHQLESRNHMLEKEKSVVKLEREGLKRKFNNLRQKYNDQITTLAKSFEEKSNLFLENELMFLQNEASLKAKLKKILQSYDSASYQTKQDLDKQMESIRDYLQRAKNLEAENPTKTIQSAIH